ncbi:unnamed protein product, partial [Ilex paraguariensis]
HTIILLLLILNLSAKEDFDELQPATSTKPPPASKASTSVRSAPLVCGVLHQRLQQRD